MTEQELFINWCKSDLITWFTDSFSEQARQRYNKLANESISKEIWHSIDTFNIESYTKDKYVIKLTTHPSIHPKYNSNTLLVVFYPSNPRAGRYQFCSFRNIRLFESFEDLKQHILSNVEGT